MFGEDLNLDCYAKKQRSDLSNLFSDYPEIKNSILHEPYSLSTSSHLVNQLKVHSEGGVKFVEKNLVTDFFASLEAVSVSGAVDAKSCLSPGREGYDSELYLLSPSSTISTEMSDEIQKAKDIIRKTTFSEINDRLSEVAIICLEYQVFPKTNQSYTIQDIFQTIYLDVYEHPLLTAESIVHEMAHLTLNQHCYVNSLVFDNEKTFYSPWKEKHRPLFSFLHSLVAFFQVVDFLLEVKPLFKNDKVAEDYLNMKIPFELKNINSIIVSAQETAHFINDPFLKGFLENQIEKMQQYD